MTDLYFGLQFILEMIFMGFIVLLIAILLIKSIVSDCRFKRIDKYLKSIGYERTLISTASVGDNHTYGYKRPNENGWNDYIRDYELIGMKLKQVKEKYS